MTRDESVGAGLRVAVTRAAGYSIGIEVERIAEILDPAGRGGDVRLEDLLDAPEARDGPQKLLRLTGGTEVLLAVCGGLEIGRRVSGPCERPVLVAAALERRCLRGVLKDGDRLVYVLDVDGVVKRLAELRQDGGSPCESD